MNERRIAATLELLNAAEYAARKRGDMTAATQYSDAYYDVRRNGNSANPASYALVGK